MTQKVIYLLLYKHVYYTYIFIKEKLILYSQEFVNDVQRKKEKMMSDKGRKKKKE